ncbi:uncharacterized protein LOC113326770 [Papaver somniferum]|uniref:uncharacterized protein LOC113326770 n=1 Tax=Papaver somniferum TaxID=3469 RepID=UPI000E70116C|nr:uncharacterized protein LOC113326770 [Papaver somniferum]XP_026430215.1 uncharacterized protein LOC113326770 [Papaver somniferum]XP_026430222.1 uncharacterized protein LOC113326770 [Papaver somniferum]XP_026430229.1 uncharacterized protein LOC113326770 [Papaver somniferum]
MEPDVEKELENDNGDDDELELENDNSSDNEEGGEGKEAKKRKYVPRGPAQMHAMKLDSVDPKKEVPFNTNEQPIGDHYVQLASVLGVLVRKLALIFRDWRVVPNQAKENIWKIVTNPFIVPEYYKDYYFSKMRTCLREARSRKAGLVLEALDQLQGEEREKRLDKLIPRTMIVREWEDFGKHVNSAEFERQKTKNATSSFKLYHPTYHKSKRLHAIGGGLQKEKNTTEDIDRADLWKVGHKQRKGKKPHLGVLKAFEKLEKAQVEHGADCGSSVTDDLLAKALGKDKKTKRRLKGMGF